MRRHHARRPRAQRGAMAAELMAMFPLIIAFGFLLFQGFLVLSTIGSVEKAARDGARAAMLGYSVPAAVERSMPNWITVQSIGSDNAGKHCPGHCVSVEARVPLGLPIWTSSDITVTRAAAMPKGVG